MMNSKQASRVSRLLTLALRHQPDALGLTLDDHGWTGVDDVLRGLDREGHRIGRTGLLDLVASNDKQRFALSDDGTRIRANQGHSIGVDLALVPRVPPERLYHGTYSDALAAIFAEGLRRMRRDHVHLSPDRATAVAVGSRRGKPIVLVVRAGDMAIAGYSFYVSDNGVWLVSDVPPAYIEHEPGPLSAPEAG